MAFTCYINKIRFALGSLLGVLLLLSCARSFNPDIERGGEFQYREGYPEARFAAIGFVDEETGPVINASVEVVYGSLVYQGNSGDSLRASVTFNIRIQDVENPDETVKDVTFSRAIASADQNIVNNQQSFIVEEQIPVDAGDYKVVLTVIDRNSNKETVRTTQTYIPDLTTDNYALSNIKLFGKEMGNGHGWVPITTYDVKGRIDSLRFVFQVISKPTDVPLTVNTRLLSFESDTTPARPMYHNTPSASSIEYKGIDYDEETEIQTTERTLTNYASVMIEYRFAQRSRGNYRFEVNTKKEDGKPYYKARDFGVKSKNYPAIQSPRELARPLVYLMDDREYERLLAIDNEDTLKAEIDRFWLRNIKSSVRAKNVIQMYYERVEQANKQFSNFQEGWKTDRGYMYVLFGPPWYVERHVDVLQWSYNYNRQDPEYNFIFRLPKLKNEFFPFNNYILQRNNFYYNIHYQQTQLWKTGRILTRQIY